VSLVLETERDYSIEKNKVWNPNVLKWICIFLSAYSGIVLYIINFYRLNHPQKRKKLAIGLSILLPISLISVFIRKYDLITLLLFMINIGLAIYFSDEQKQLFYEHMQNGGQKASSILAWIFGVLILLGIIIVYLVLGFLVIIFLK
jgi:hypothetical protein